MLLLYAGLAWAADAREMMLLSFVGPAVRTQSLRLQTIQATLSWLPAMLASRL